MRNVSRTTVSRWVSTGRIPTVGGKVDVDVALEQLEANSGIRQDLDPHPNAPPAAPKGSNGAGGAERRVANTVREAAPRDSASVSFAQSRAVREALSARILRLEYDEKVGTLVDAEEARTAAFNTGRRTRELLQAIPDRIAPELEGRTREDIHRLLSEEIRRICEEVSRWASL